MNSRFKWLMLGLLEVLLSLFFVVLFYWQVLAIGSEFGHEILLPLGLGVIACLLGVFVVHELGHLVAGNDAGLNIQRLVLGPLAFTRRNGSLRPMLNTKLFRIAFCVVFEHPNGVPQAKPWKKMILGGPLANLFVGVACIVTEVLCGCGASTPDPGVKPSATISRFILYQGNLNIALIGIAGVANILVGLMNLIPATVGKYRTDGGQLLDLWKLGKLTPSLGYSLDALLFINLTISELLKVRRKENNGQVTHITGGEFCKYLLTSRGSRTPDILRGYGLNRSEDVGRMIFGLVNLGLMGRREEDSEADFVGIFNLDERIPSSPLPSTTLIAPIPSGQ
jgi:uncharacterized repeat protein (TIGR04138 family)